MMMNKSDGCGKLLHQKNLWFPTSKMVALDWRLGIGENDIDIYIYIVLHQPIVC
jgi:hypothetical protein